jgi:hypothetical protein
VTVVRGMARPEYMRHRDRMIAYGRWQPWVPAAPAREHVRYLSTRGVGWEQAAALAGVSRGTVSKLLYGTKGSPPTRRIRPETEAAILAVRPALDVVDDRTIVDATGTRRRLQGLAWQGWSMARLSARLGPRCHLSSVLSRDVRVRASTARAVQGLCRELCGQLPPEGTRAERAAAARTRNHAREMGWVPLAAWDAIDDPDAQPVPGWQRSGRGVGPQDAVELDGYGVHPEMIAVRLGVTPETVRRCLQRARQDPKAEAAEGDDSAAA